MCTNSTQQWEQVYSNLKFQVWSQESPNINSETNSRNKLWWQKTAAASTVSKGNVDKKVKYLLEYVTEHIPKLN